MVAQHIEPGLMWLTSINDLEIVGLVTKLETKEQLIAFSCHPGKHQIQIRKKLLHEHCCIFGKTSKLHLLDTQVLSLSKKKSVFNYQQ